MRANRINSSHLFKGEC